MRGAINLDDQPSVEGSEVGDEAAKDNLTSKAEAGESLAPKAFPETSFGTLASRLRGRAIGLNLIGMARPPP